MACEAFNLRTNGLTKLKEISLVNVCVVSLVNICVVSLVNVNFQTEIEKLRRNVEKQRRRRGAWEREVSDKVRPDFAEKSAET